MPSDAWAFDATPVTTRIGDAMIVTLPRELSDEALTALRHSVLEKLQKARARSMILEASGLDVIDQREFDELTRIARGARWLGVRPMLVGLSPGVVAYLVDVGVDTSAFEPFGQLDDALAAMQPPAGAEHADDDAAINPDDPDSTLGDP
jgi:anti-anti-sigma regulatory factor